MNIDNLNRFQVENLVEQMESRIEDLTSALKSLFGLVESGVLVRDTSHDNDPKWYLKAIELTQVLAQANTMLKDNGHADQWSNEQADAMLKAREQ